MQPRNARDPVRNGAVASERQGRPRAVSAVPLARFATTALPANLYATADALKTSLHRVVCGDAFESGATFDAWFVDEAVDPRRADSGCLVRLGDVVCSAAALVAAVEGAMYEGALPAAVLVHENLLSSASGARGDGALQAVRTLKERLGRADAPPCVLVTARLHPPEIYRFRLAGGAHAIDCATQNLAARRAVIAAAIRGERWRHSPCPPRVAFSPRDLDLLPFLEADVSANEIARHLRITDTQVHDARRALYRRLHDAAAVDFVLSGHTNALAAAALRAGAIWVPLQ